MFKTIGISAVALVAIIVLMIVFKALITGVIIVGGAYFLVSFIKKTTIGD